MRPPLPLGWPFDGFVEHTKPVPPICLVNFEHNRCSVPASFADRRANLRIYPERIVVVTEGQILCLNRYGFACRLTRYGYQRIHLPLRCEGWQVNHKRVRRRYREEDFNPRQTPAAARGGGPPNRARGDHSAQRVGLVDFVSDALFSGKRLAHIATFNARLRDACLNTHWFLSLEDARGKIEARRRNSNEDRPHTSLGCLTPAEFASSAGVNPEPMKCRKLLRVVQILGQAQVKLRGTVRLDERRGHVEAVKRVQDGCYENLPLDRRMRERIVRRPSSRRPG